MVEKSVGHVAFIGKYEFYMLANGWLMRAPISEPVSNDGYRPGEARTFGSGIELELRLARIEPPESKE